MRILIALLLSAALAVANPLIVVSGRPPVATGFAPSSASWDGVNDRMNFSGSAVTMSGSGTQFTISFWVYSNSNAAGPCVIQGRDAAGGSQWRINIASSNTISARFPEFNSSHHHAG